MSDQNIKLMMLAHGDARDRKSFSGTNYGLLSALERQTGAIATADVELKGLQRYLCLLQSFNFNKARWKQDYRLSERSYQKRSNLADEAIKQKQKELDAIFHMGGEFTCHKSASIPVFSYHDNISILSKLGGQYSFNYNATPRISKRFIELEKEALAKNTGLFTFSDRIKNAMVEHYGISADKIFTVYAGLNIDTSRLPKSFGDEKYASKNILFVGRDFERKGGEDVVNAFVNVRKKLPDAHLHIVGCEPAVQLENITIHGFIDQNTEQGRKKLLDLYSTATVFTMPSHFEPFGIPHCEAMFYSTPCVGSNIGAMPEIIENEKTGYVCPVANVESLTEAYISILSDSEYARVLGRNGYEKAINNYSWDIVAEKMLTFIKNRL